MTAQILSFPARPPALRLVVPTSPRIVHLWAEMQSAIREHHNHPSDGTRHVMEQARVRYVRAMQAEGASH